MTKYETVFDRFLSKIEDMDLPQLTDEDRNTELNIWLNTALARIEMQHINTKNDLSKRDDENQTFTEDLSNRDIEIVALYMVVSWYEPRINSLEHTLMYFGTKEEKWTSQKDHLNAMKASRTMYQREARLLASDFDFAHNSYLGTDE